MSCIDTLSIDLVLVSLFSDRQEVKIDEAYDGQIMIDGSLGGGMQ
jgi:hypothetical protein